MIDLHFEDYRKVLRVIRSCKTPEQLKVAKRYARQYFKHPSTHQFMCGFRDIVNKQEERIGEIYVNKNK